MSGTNAVATKSILSQREEEIVALTGLTYMPDAIVECTITPDIASKILAKYNNNNRRISCLTVDNLVRTMQNGEFYATEPIVFTDDGELYEGQHRLKAIEVSGLPQHIFIQMHAPRDVRLNNVGSRKRTVADRLSVGTGIPHKKAEKLAGFLRQTIAGNMSQNTHANPDLKNVMWHANNVAFQERTYHQYQKELDTAFAHYDNRYGNIFFGVIARALISTQNYAGIRDFLDRFITNRDTNNDATWDKTDKRNNPIYALYSWEKTHLSTNRKRSLWSGGSSPELKKNIYRAVSQALSHFLEGKNLERIKLFAAVHEAFPCQDLDDATGYNALPTYHRVKKAKAAVASIRKNGSGTGLTPPSVSDLSGLLPGMGQ